MTVSAHRHPLGLLCLSLVVATLTAGCEAVTTTVPIGDPVPKPDAVKTLDGLWVGSGDEDLFVLVRQHDDGRLVIGMLEADEDRFAIRHIDGLLTLHREAAYLHLDRHDFEDKDDGPDPDPVEYLFFRLLPTGEDQLVLLAPEKRFFAQAIESGRLAGEVERNDQRGIRNVRIDGGKAQLDALADPAAVGEQFVVDQPWVWTRVAGGDD
ncbi:MAG: hypothetical protein AAFX76_05615 [Planctomycetota bacterium]